MTNNHSVIIIEENITIRLWGAKYVLFKLWQEIQNSVKFCSNCGNAISEQQENQTEKTTNAINRDVVIQYLNDIRTLEVAKEKLYKRMEETTEKCKGLGIPQLLRKDYEDNSDALIWLGIFILICGIFMVICGTLTNMIKVTIVSFVFFFGGAVCMLCYFKSKSNYEQNEINYNNAVYDDRQRVEKELQEKEQLENDYENMKGELAEAENLLEKSYSVNLIPLQYRNIQAVFYLYNYLSTSQENLQSALLQCNLEEIKFKMDTMIEQQSEMILEMAIQNARLEEMKSQNRRILQHAVQIERNTALAAQYAEIAANNAKATAWIGLANYIKD